MPSHAALRPTLGLPQGPRQRRHLTLVVVLVVAAAVVAVLVWRGSAAGEGGEPRAAASDRPSATASTSSAASTAVPTPVATRPSRPERPIQVRVVRAGKPPRLDPTPVVGERLVARGLTGAGWTPGTRFRFQWLLDGRPIRGATQRVLVPSAQMLGHQVSVRVRGVLSGHQPAAVSSAAHRVLPDNPLAGGSWAVYKGPWNGIWPAYEQASGTDKALLGRIALRPRVIWFGPEFATDVIEQQLRDFIARQQAEYGQDALIQLAVFREWPGGEGARGRPLSGAQQADYRAWVDAAARAIGNARVAMVLEPDLGLNAVPNNSWELRTADPEVRLGLVRYAAQQFSGLPRTSVYLDASDSDWLAMGKIIPVLRAAGIEYARGFALGATHYSSVADNIDYGLRIIDELNAVGIRDKHFVIDTADNGRAFTWLQHRAEHPGADFDNAATCRSVQDSTCDTLGVPPTADVAGQPGLGLSPAQRQAALRHVDGYLWFGRPWLVRQASPFSLARSLEVARSTPFA